jgi:L-iditol 2-dehydrogenase
MNTPRGDTMRGAMLLGPGKVEVRSLPVPRPATGEMLLRVDAATTCGTDVKVFRRGGHPRMLTTPTLFGHEVAGTVSAIGKDVVGLIPGQRVVVANSAPCGHCAACARRRENLCQDLHYLNGAFAEYLLVPARFVERSVYPIPEPMPAERAALSEPLACVLHGIDACAEVLQQSPADAGATVAVLGGGPIGLLFVASLSRMGHTVLLGDPNPGRLQAGRAMGAVHTASLRREGGNTSRLLEALDGARPDVTIDCTGAPAAWADALDSVRAGGLVNLFGGCAPGTSVPLDTHRIHYGEITVKGVYHHRPDSFRRAIALLTQADFPAEVLLSDHQPIERVAEALQSMIDKRCLKVVVAGTGD